MLNLTLRRLENAAHRMAGAHCPRCGGSNGVGGVPLVMLMGRWDGDDHTTYNADGRCPRCGAVPPHVVNITATLAGDQNPAEAKG